MALAEGSWSPKQLAQRLLECLQNPEIASYNEFWTKHNSDDDRIYEELRIESDQFASIYPLLERRAGDEMMCPILNTPLINTLFRCSQYSISVNLLAKEKRVWKFLMVDYDDSVIEGKDRCIFLVQTYMIIEMLIPYVNEITWTFAVRCGLLKHLLAGIQNKPHTCGSYRIQCIIAWVLGRPITQGSLDMLVSGGLFTLLEQLIYKNGKLLKRSPPCAECNIDPGENKIARYFLRVKKKKKKPKFFILVTPVTGCWSFFFFF